MRRTAWAGMLLLLAGCAVTPWKGPRADAGLTKADAHDCMPAMPTWAKFGGPVMLGVWVGSSEVGQTVDECMRGRGYTK